MYLQQVCTLTLVVTCLRHAATPTSIETAARCATQVGKHANYTRLFAICAHMWHADAVLAALEPLTAADVAAWMQQALRACHVECLLHGNLTADEAKALVGVVTDALGRDKCTLPGKLRDRLLCAGSVFLKG